jgi:hypothetical protein
MRRLLVLMALLAGTVSAEEMKCGYIEGGNAVRCPKAAYSTLVQGCADFRSDAKACGVKLAAAETSRLDAMRALDKCVESFPKPRSVWLGRAATGLAVLGGAALAIGFVDSDSSAITRAQVAGVGLVSVGVAYWLASSD